MVSCSIRVLRIRSVITQRGILRLLRRVSAVSMAGVDGETTKRRGTEKVCPQKECGYSIPAPELAPPAVPDGRDR